MTVQPRRFMGLEFRDVLNILVVVVGLAAWGIRTESRIDAVRTESLNANELTNKDVAKVADSLRDVTMLVREIQSRQDNVRLWIAGHDGAEASHR